MKVRTREAVARTLILVPLWLAFVLVFLAVIGASD